MPQILHFLCSTMLFMMIDVHRLIEKRLEGREEEEGCWTKLRFHAATLHMIALQTTKNAVHIPSHRRIRSIISTWVQNM